MDLALTPRIINLDAKEGSVLTRKINMQLVNILTIVAMKNIEAY
jgi:hypothetical protein